MSRLPTPGQDNGNWGAILNDFLEQSHNNDGSLKESAIPKSTDIAADGTSDSKVPSVKAVKTYTDKKVGEVNTQSALLSQKYNLLRSVDGFLGITTLDYDTGLISDLALFHFKYVRITMWWNRVEATQGVYTFTQYDSVINQIISEGMTPVIILSGRADNPGLYGINYPDNDSVTTEEQRTAYANYVSAVVNHYKDHGIIWEIWNEPNFSHWSPQTDNTPIDYTNMVKKVYPIIKTIDPTSTVSTPVIGYSGYPGHIEWLVTACENGLMDYTDVMAFHTYYKYEENPPAVLPSPETFLGDIVRDVRDIISRYTDRQIPINLSEYGYSIVPEWDGTGSRAVTDETTRCKYLVREMLLGLIYGLNTVMIYSATANEADNYNLEHWFGLWGPTFEPKPAAYAVKAAMEALKGLSYVNRIYTAQGDFVLRFIDSDNVIHYAAWTVETAHTIKIGTTNIALTDTVQVVATSEVLDIFSESDYQNYAGKKKLIGQSAPNFAEMFNSPFNKATGDYSHAEGDNTNANGNCSHAEGYQNFSNGMYSHAEGDHNTADLDSSHVEGTANIAGISGHAEGSFNIGYGGDVYTITAYNATDKTLTLDTVTGLSVNDVVIIKRNYLIYLKTTILAINGLTVTIDLAPSSDCTYLVKPITGRGVTSVGGTNNLACGSNSRVTGSGNIAAATHAFIHGIGLLAKGAYQAVFGKYNVSDTTNLFVVGNGASATERSNAMVLDASGNPTFSGSTVQIVTAKTPTSATDTGTAGMICWDSNYIYVCTATNTWKRVALTTW